MNKTLRLILAAWLFFIVSGRADFTARPMPAPVIDGVVDNAEWAPALRCDGFSRLGRVAAVNQESLPTVAWLGYDQDHLYVAFRCTIRKGIPLKLEQTEEDSDIEYDDSVEVFINGSPGSNTYLHFAQSAAGVRFDAEVKGGASKLNRKWSSSLWRNAAKYNDEFFDAEFAFPLAIIPFDGSGYLRINLTRTVRAGGTMHLTLAPMLGDGWQQPEKFLRLNLPPIALYSKITASRRSVEHVLFGRNLFRCLLKNHTKEAQTAEVTVVNSGAKISSTFPLAAEATQELEMPWQCTSPSGIFSWELSFDGKKRYTSAPEGYQVEPGFLHVPAVAYARDAVVCELRLFHAPEELRKAKVEISLKSDGQRETPPVTVPFSKKLRLPRLSPGWHEIELEVLSNTGQQMFAGKSSFHLVGHYITPDIDTSAVISAPAEARDKRTIPGEQETTMEFIVLGDIHYCSASGKTQGLVRALHQDLQNKGIVPAFICQLGDVIENQQGSSPVPNEEGTRQWEMALQDIKAVFSNTPFFISPGNHDWYGNNSWFGGKENLHRHLLPFLQKELDSAMNGQLFYSFRTKNSLFIFTNHAGMEIGLDFEQREWLEKNLAGADANPSIEHVFVFGHCGLWNVNYVRFNENAELLPILAESKKLKAYFAGHVHRNNMTVWRFPGKNPVFQVVTAGLFADSMNLPQEEHFLTLNPPLSQRGYMGFPQNAPSYCRITISAGKVRLRFEKIAGTTLADIEFNTPGEIRENHMLKTKISRRLPPQVRDLKLRMYPFFPERLLGRSKTPDIIFNGRLVGNLPFNNTAWHVNRFQYSLKLPPELLQKTNTIEFRNPNCEAFLIRDCQLEAVDQNGVSHFSELYPAVIAAGNPCHTYMNFGLIHPERGIMYSSLQYNVPNDMLQVFPIDSEFTIQLMFQ